ncbi:hypothetical protein GGR53DRAFT_361437 [Hypoxylon sp. FL1150]|nr:hypothetical protein GGR53DRAFT_361437 [Hypoxylon sp. FL1150]
MRRNTNIGLCHRLQGCCQACHGATSCLSCPLSVGGEDRNLAIRKKNVSRRVKVADTELRIWEKKCRAQGHPKQLEGFEGGTFCFVFGQLANSKTTNHRFGLTSTKADLAGCLIQFTPSFPNSNVEFNGPQPSSLEFATHPNYRNHPLVPR